MYLKCSICKEISKTETEFFKHLRKNHDTPTDCEFTCMDPTCGKIFSNFFSFRAHIKNHTKKELKCTNSNVIPNLSIQIESDHSPEELLESPNLSFMSVSELDENDNRELIANHSVSNTLELFNPVQNSNTNHIENLTDSSKSQIKLALTLHSKPNITRKNVTEICKSVNLLRRKIYMKLLHLINVLIPQKEF